MKRKILISGLPGSGKTLKAHQIAAKRKTITLQLNEKDNPSENPMYFQECTNETQVIIIDELKLTPKVIKEVELLICVDEIFVNPPRKSPFIMEIPLIIFITNEPANIVHAVFGRFPGYRLEIQHCTLPA